MHLHPSAHEISCFFKVYSLTFEEIMKYSLEARLIGARCEFLARDD